MARNLLFITTDQQRWDSLPCYGLDFMQTPNLDRLAREGMVFENCIVPSPVCVPCRASMMCGQYPAVTGVLGNGNWLPDHVPTWPSLIGKTGRRTAAIGKMHFNPWDSLQGFDERIMAEDKRHIYLPDHHVQFLAAHGLDRPHPTTLPQYYENLGASVTPRDRKFHVDGFVGDQAAQWLEKNGKDPFAAWVSFPGPHDPYDPPEDMADLYANAPIPDLIGSPEELANKPAAQRARGGGSLNNSMFRLDFSKATPENYRKWREHYYANITLIDEGIGKMLGALESQGTLDDTLIIFTSDHGDALGDHGLPFKGFFYDCMSRVPLIIRGPDVPTNQRSAALVSSLDLVPLFYNACETEAPNTLQGEDIRPLFNDPSTTIREAAFSEIGGRMMVRTTHYKYAHYSDGSAELYDLEADPNEITNLAGNSTFGDIENQLKALLLEHGLHNQTYQSRYAPAPQYWVRNALEADYKKQQTEGGDTKYRPLYRE
ncbi:MAG: sulfatase-like hydrolase/transferase [Candidatus Latescibacteria bacterium]|jgi:arylsulfatase|nr:sulfatase-like hydrolase/transferase [Candidatus Latescibacterota bacterium]